MFRCLFSFSRFLSPKYLILFTIHTYDNQFAIRNYYQCQWLLLHKVSNHNNWNSIQVHPLFVGWRIRWQQSKLIICIEVVWRKHNPFTDLLYIKYWYWKNYFEFGTISAKRGETSVSERTNKHALEILFLLTLSNGFPYLSFGKSTVSRFGISASLHSWINNYYFQK